MNICRRCLKPNTNSLTACDDCRNYGKVFYDMNRERYKRERRDRSLRDKYGISYSDFEKMLSEQGGKCGICETEMTLHSKKKWGGNKEACVDHDHKTSKVRGLLCRNCNLRLAVIDDEEFVSKAKKYLNKKEK